MIFVKLSIVHFVVVRLQARILDHLDIDTNVVTANVAVYLEKRGDLELAAVLYDRAKVNRNEFVRNQCEFLLENSTIIINLQSSSI